MKERETGLRIRKLGGCFIAGIVLTRALAFCWDYVWGRRSLLTLIHPHLRSVVFLLDTSLIFRDSIVIIQLTDLIFASAFSFQKKKKLKFVFSSTWPPLRYLKTDESLILMKHPLKAASRFSCILVTCSALVCHFVSIFPQMPS